MSLPATHKDISAHPAKDSVVDPVNKVNKDADIDRKARSFFASPFIHFNRNWTCRFVSTASLTPFARENFPSNAQIDQTLRYVVDHSPVDLDKLSPDGKKLIQESRDIITTAR
jgi:hypothetical protein